jgi:DNA invertase Pin-like site-specific DNA recombinase
MIAYRYLRVSTNDQESGLKTQDYTTEKVAKELGINIKETFEDNAISGGIAQRAGFDALKLALTNSKISEKCLIVYDISRLGRDIIIGEEFIKLCRLLKVKLITKDKKWYDFSQRSDRLSARFMFLLATDERETINDKTMDGAIAAMEQGRYIFASKPGSIKGYRFQTVKGVRYLKPYEPESTIVTEALEGFASGRFENQTQVRNFLVERGLPCSKDFKRIRLFLANPLYAGYLEYLPWGITFRKCHEEHVSLITLETHNKILEKLKMKPRGSYQVQSQDTFPLRRFVACDECDYFLTACFVKGRNKKYKSYFCQNPKCSLNRKHINGEKLESEFEELLKSIKPSNWVIDTTREVFHLEWQKRNDETENRLKKAKQKLESIDQSIEAFLSRLESTTNQTILKIYEGKIEKMEKDKLTLAEEVGELTKQDLMTEAKYRTYLDKALITFKNLEKLWEIGDIKTKRGIQKLLFSGKIKYNINSKYRTSQKSAFYSIILDISESENDVGGPATHQYQTSINDFVKLIADLVPILESYEIPSYTIV